MLFTLHLRAAVRSLSTSAARPAAMAKNFYAVAAGRQRGLFRSWEQCQLQVKGYPNAVFKGFKTEEEARQFLTQHGIELAHGSAPSAAAAAASALQAALDAAPAQPRKRRAADDNSERGTKRHAAAALGAAAAKAEAAEAAGGAPAAAAAASAAAATATDRVLRLEFDGGSKGNPGPAGFGAVLYDEASGVEVARLCQYLGDHHTNNQAEYAGLIAGLLAALELGCRRLKVQGDSMLIINQVLGQWQVKNEGLRPYHRLAQQLASRFDHFEAKQVLREFNQVADALSNQAIDDYRSGANRQLWTLEAAAAEAAAETGGGGTAGLVAELHAVDAVEAAEEGAADKEAAGAAAEGAAAAATAAEDGGGGSGGADKPAD